MMATRKRPTGYSYQRERDNAHRFPSYRRHTSVIDTRMRRVWCDIVPDRSVRQEIERRESANALVQL